jgi:hypothetical protein
MTTTATTDPWAVRDHDPTSITEPMTGTGDIDTTTRLSRSPAPTFTPRQPPTTRTSAASTRTRR